MEPVDTVDSKNYDINPTLLKDLDRILEKLKSEDVASIEFYQNLGELSELLNEGTSRRDRQCLTDHVVASFDLNATFSRVWSAMLQNSNRHSEESDSEEDNNLVGMSCKLLLDCLMAFTDSSEKVCTYFGETGILHVLLQGLKHGNLTPRIVELIAIIVHNCCWLVPGNRVLCKGYITFLQNLTEATDRTIQAVAFFALAYIVDESDHDKLALSKSCVTFLLYVLSEALDSPSRMSPSTSYSALEVIQGIHQLSVNDDNKRMIVDFDGIDVLERIILDPRSSDREKEFAAKAIWQLGFIDEHKAVIRERSALIERLKSLKKTSASQELQEACSGVMFVVNDIDKYCCGQDSHGGSRVKPSPGEERAHIMISYQHASQATMIRVKEYLQSKGYNVWMDIDRMEGDILEAMARAVEKSDVVLVCMSREFKESHNCRTEATYAYTLKKEIIPLKLEEGYTPDGWLGALLGMKLYYPMSSQEHIDTNLPTLIGVLGKRGKLEPSVIPACTNEVGNKPALDASSDSLDEPDSGKPREEQHAPQQLRAKPLKSDGVASWSQDEVHDWLKSIGLDATTNSSLQTVSGTRISQIRSLMDRAPEYCLKAMEKQYGLSFEDVLSFVSGLENI